MRHSFAVMQFCLFYTFILLFGNIYKGGIFDYIEKKINFTSNLIAENQGFMYVSSCIKAKNETNFF